MVLGESTMGVAVTALQAEGVGEGVAETGEEALP